VIVYRASPGVKAEFVNWVRKNKPEVKTLAVGDGANDVHMIQ
jgi:magnesium-transporting ATPase (P-type)